MRTVGDGWGRLGTVEDGWGRLGTGDGGGTGLGRDGDGNGRGWDALRIGIFTENSNINFSKIFFSLINLKKIVFEIV